MSIRLLFPEKHFLPIFVIDAGKVILVNKSQSKKQSSGMFVIPSGIVKRVKDRHPQKHLSPM